MLTIDDLVIAAYFCLGHLNRMHRCSKYSKIRITKEHTNPFSMFRTDDLPAGFGQGGFLRHFGILGDFFCLPGGVGIVICLPCGVDVAGCSPCGVGDCLC